MSGTQAMIFPSTEGTGLLRFVPCTMAAVEGEEEENVSIPVHGELLYRDGGKYVGAIATGGVREGRGTYTTPSGDKYEGFWRADKKDGPFVVTYSNGEVFEGPFKEGRRCGSGTLKYTDGSKFVGSWEDDMRHGRGFFYTSHEYFSLQKLFLRRYEHGILAEEYEIYTPKQLLADRPGFGVGVHVDEATGERYEGEYVDYQRHGRGTITYGNGDSYFGDFEFDKRHGPGILKNYEGTLYLFQWYERGVKTREQVTDALNYKNLFWYDEGGISGAR